MPSEAIPGMGERVRAGLKRRVAGDAESIRRIDELTIQELYAQGPLDAIQRVVGATPEDSADINQWTKYRDEAQRSLGPKQINAWIRNLQKAHNLGTGK